MERLYYKTILVLVSDCNVIFVLHREQGAHVELLSPATIQQRYPWINTEGIALACMGKSISYIARDGISVNLADKRLPIFDQSRLPIFYPS